MQEVLEDANKGTFRELASFARAQQCSPSKRRTTSAGYQRLLPTALTVAGGVNSSDHARTFPDLVSLLRAQVPLLDTEQYAEIKCCCFSSLCLTGSMKPA